MNELDLEETNRMTEQMDGDLKAREVLEDVSKMTKYDAEKAVCSDDRDIKSRYPETVDILGTTYRIEFKTSSEDPGFKGHPCAGGFCSALERRIVIKKPENLIFPEGFDYESKVRGINKILRHEIVHSFLSESGLEGNTESRSRGWAKNEEMVDWIAIQGPKIMKAWKDANCEA